MCGKREGLTDTAATAAAAVAVTVTVLIAVCGSRRSVNAGVNASEEATYPAGGIVLRRRNGVGGKGKGRNESNEDSLGVHVELS